MTRSCLLAREMEYCFSKPDPQYGLKAQAGDKVVLHCRLACACAPIVWPVIETMGTVRVD